MSPLLQADNVAGNWGTVEALPVDTVKQLLDS